MRKEQTELEKLTEEVQRLCKNLDSRFSPHLVSCTSVPAKVIVCLRWTAATGSLGCLKRGWCGWLIRSGKQRQFRQPNVAMAMTVDVHEHCPSDKERIFVNSRIRLLRHAGQFKNPLSQFMMKLVWGFHTRSFLCGGGFQ